jgi:hypothetical protein
MLLHNVINSIAVCTGTLLGSPRCFGTVDQEIAAQCISLLNCADPDLLTYMQYNIERQHAPVGKAVLPTAPAKTLECPQ